MIATMVKVKADENGNVEIPTSFWREIGIEPNQEVEVMVTPLKVNKPVTPVKLTDADRARLKRIGELIEETFKGMDLDYVREGRRDRWL